MRISSPVRSIIVVAALVLPAVHVPVRADAAELEALPAAQLMFYNGRYAEAAAAAGALCAPDFDALLAC